MGEDALVPIIAALYHDGRHIRAYIPQAGNPWNTITQTQLGHNAFMWDLKFLEWRYPDQVFTNEAGEEVRSTKDLSRMYGDGRKKPRAKIKEIFPTFPEYLNKDEILSELNKALSLKR